MSGQLGMFEENEGALNNNLPLSDNWVSLLAEENIRDTERLISKVNTLREAKTIYPDKEEVFKAFELLPKDVKVVILGQDPYYNGNANGRAFACKLNISPSLRKIIEATGMNIYSKRNLLLEGWQEQGVLLLNTILTVEKQEPLSHKEIGWDKFILPLLANFSNRYKDVVYMLWGANAKAYRKHINETNNLILECTHPAFAARQGFNWECDNFEKANEYLRENNKEEIIWNY